MRDKNRTKRWLLDWFERKGIAPTMNHKRDLEVYKSQVKLPKYNEHEVRK